MGMLTSLHVATVGEGAVWPDYLVKRKNPPGCINLQVHAAVPIAPISFYLHATVQKERSKTQKFLTGRMPSAQKAG